MMLGRLEFASLESFHTGVCEKLPQQSSLTVIFSNPVRNPVGILLESCCNLEFLLESGWNRDLIMWETFWKPAG